ncbi:MAG: hydrogenase iron-sulfur subunit [Pirellulales bacterium]
MANLREHCSWVHPGDWEGATQKAKDLVAGAIIVAIGLDVYDPTEMDEYGYARFDNVITSMEFERLICAGGSTAGQFVRPSDHQRPKRIGFIQCVGSRNPKIGRPYCSNICCMNTIKDSVCQAGAAASRAGALLGAGQIQVEAITSRIDQQACTKCGVCAPVCPYGAILWQKGEPATVVEAACAGCGACAASCLFSAITMRHFTDGQLLAQIQAVLADSPHKKVFAFACNWCSYAGGDMAGISRLPCPASSRVIRTLCSARVSEVMVLEAFRCGAPVVLVSGCHYADCHYIDANRQTVKRVQKLWNKLEKAGVRPERLQLEWISAAEGQKFAKVMGQMEELMWSWPIRAATPPNRSSQRPAIARWTRLSFSTPTPASWSGR